MSDPCNYTKFAWWREHNTIKCNRSQDNVVLIIIKNQTLRTLFKEQKKLYWKKNSSSRGRQRVNAPIPLWTVLNHVTICNQCSPLRRRHQTCSLYLLICFTDFIDIRHNLDFGRLKFTLLLDFPSLTSTLCQTLILLTQLFHNKQTMPRRHRRSKFCELRMSFTFKAQILRLYSKTDLTDTQYMGFLFDKRTSHLRDQWRKLAKTKQAF